MWQGLQGIAAQSARRKGYGMKQERCPECDHLMSVHNKCGCSLEIKFVGRMNIESAFCPCTRPIDGFNSSLKELADRKKSASRLAERNMRKVMPFFGLYHLNEAPEDESHGSIGDLHPMRVDRWKD